MSNLFENLNEQKNIIGEGASRTIVFKLDPINLQAINSHTLDNELGYASLNIPTSFTSKSLFFSVSGETTKEIPKDKITVPVCPGSEVTDEVIFEEATDATKKLYLPRYRLAEETVSGQQQYRISIEPFGQGWRLIVYLEAYPAPKIENEVRDTKIIPHEARVILKCRWQGQPTEWEFQEVIQQEGGQTLKAVLQLHSLEERDRAYLTLTDSTYSAALVVSRQVKVAIPIELSSQSRQTPATVILYPEADSYVSELNNQSNFSSSNFLEVAPSEGICWNRGQYRTYLRFDLSSIPRGVTIESASFQMTSTTGFAYGRDGNQYVHSVSDNTWGESSLTWNNMPILGERLGHWWTWYGFPCGKNLETRKFSIDITSQMATKLAGDQKLSLSVQSSGYWVRYYSRKESNTANRPQLIVTYSTLYTLYREVTMSLNDTVDDTFFFPALLYEYIFRNIKPTHSQGIHLIRRQVEWNGIWYSYYQDERERYRFYYLPDSFQIGRSSDSQQPTMSLQFQSIDGSEEMLQAKLDYYASPCVNSERLKAAAAKLRRYVPSPLPDGVEGLEFAPLDNKKNLQFHLTLPNSNSSSNLAQNRSTRLSLQVGIVGTLTLPVPDDFQAAWDAMFSTRRENTLFTGQVVVELEGDYSEEIPFQIRLEGDPETLLNTILQPNMPTTYVKTIEVKTFKSMFDPPESRPQDQILTILVDFERSDTIELTTDKLTATAKVTLPISDIILRRIDAGIYRYKLEVIRRKGKQTYDWRETSMEILYPDVEV